MEPRINVLLALMIIASFLLALPLHEFGHALMAYWLGDRTPAADDRFTLRLRPHVDPIGLLLCIMLAFSATPLPVSVGYGKPVKTDPWKLKTGPNSGTLIVAIAGMVFSLLVGLIAALIAFLMASTLLPATPQGLPSILLLRVIQFVVVFATMNISLALFNLLPIYPLDGYQILYSVLPSRQAIQFAKSAQYGPFIILAIFFLIPFLAQLPGLGFLSIFVISRYIFLGAMSLESLMWSGIPDSFGLLLRLYVQ